MTGFTTRNIIVDNALAKIFCTQIKVGLQYYKKIVGGVLVFIFSNIVLPVTMMMFTAVAVHVVVGFCWS